ncbi:MAG: isochorismatase family cysteine hydrolase [Methanocorpusculum sp.]|nr:isochorismatase family cysteine hydrolase [Methanocorpusculum sp.]
MKKILVVVDYQNDFVNGSLGFKKAEEIEQNIAEKINLYRERGDEIIFTLDTHENNYSDTQEGKLLPVPHCIKGTKGHELAGKIAALKKDTDIVFEKHSFGSAELLKYLTDKKCESVELVGLVSNICVISNAVLVKTALPETPVIVDASCTASNDDRLNEEALDVMAVLQIKIIGSKNV